MDSIGDLPPSPATAFALFPFDYIVVGGGQAGLTVAARYAHVAYPIIN